MEITIGNERLIGLLEKQLNSLYEWENEEAADLREIMPEALERTAHCFQCGGDGKYYRNEGGALFDPYHTSQYTIFLYYVANTLWRKAASTSAATKVYSLNKALNCVDIFYEVCLPDVFYTDHPVGTVLGRAKYGNNFSFFQNCTVGNNRGFYPVLGSDLVMHTGASILGTSNIGDNVVIAAHTYIKDENVPSETIVFGQSPNLIFKRRTDLGQNA